MLRGLRTPILLVLGSLLLSAAAPVPRVSLDVKDADLHNVLRLLSDTGKINIIVPDEVKGRVTIKLRDVPWTRALDIILSSKGLGSERQGNLIYVDTLERLIARKRIEAELRTAQQESAETVTVLIPVSYATASELLPLVRSMLSPKGSATVDVRTNTLIITDVPDSVARARESLAR
jgi:type IV pilus assembly protein PilQ